MQKGITLVELMISMAIATILILATYSMHSMAESVYRSTREDWGCMQSLRTALLQLDQDLLQCAYLMPQDLKIVSKQGELFIGGLPVTTQHTGLRLNGSDPPPYFSVVTAREASGLRLDTVDIDQDAVPDFWADLGIITDNGAYVISHAYARGNAFLPLKTRPFAAIGDRVIPAIHYDIRDDGLYRNGQLLAEGIDVFHASVEGVTLTVYLRVTSHGTTREIHYAYPIG